MALCKKCRHDRSDWPNCGCSWYADLRVDGARRYINLGPDRRAAEREHRALAGRIENGTLAAPDDSEAAFDQLARRWMRLQEQRVAPNTIRAYRAALAHAVKWFGDGDIRAITAASIAEMEAELVRAGLSPTFVRHVRRATRSVIGLAVDAGLVADVPDMRRHTISRRRKEARFLQPAEITAACASLPEPYRAMTEFTYLTGMRPGEVIGLEGGDIRGGQVLVQRTVHSSTGATGPTKTRQNRLVDLSPRAIELLPTDRGEGERLFGVTYTPWLRYWHDALSRAGIEQAGLHALRHSNVALRVAAGQDMVYIADQLGHSTAHFTLKVYGHLLRRPVSQADRLDETFRQLGSA